MNTKSEQTLIGEPRFKLGTEIQIAGMVLQGINKTWVLLFEEAEPLNMHDVILDQFTHEEWKDLLFQLDVLEVEILDPNNPNQKKIVRKTQREIEQRVSWNVFRRDNFTCQYCFNEGVCTVDHIVCWEDLGQSVEDNLITACRKCNKTRGNTPFVDWIKSDYVRQKLGRAYPLQGDKLFCAWDKASKLPLRTVARSR